ncbi:MAG: DUF748 domain-containing protein [Deltaproteobacteria bacterium]|nr:DUF748 domain-containing protein [Deltaproteobacteria bacterium]
MDGTERGRFAGLVASPRRRVGLAVVVVLLITRALLPVVLRPMLVERADEALVGHVELDDLDLSLLRGGLTLHGVSVHLDERPATAPPLFEARRLWTQISWLALLSRTIEIEDFELEGFAVRLDRDADGLRLPRLAETDAAAAEEDEELEPARPWSFAADAVSLRDGHIELADHTVRGEPEKFDLAIEDLTARELAVRTVPGDDEPGRIAIDAKLDQGAVSLTSWIQPYAEGVDVRSTLVLDDIPIDKLRAYLADFGWRELSGTVDASLEHRFESGGAHLLSGKTALSDLQITVRDQPGPALTWKKLEVVLDGVDLVKRHAEIASITSTGARVVVDPRAEIPLALLAGRAPEKEADSESDEAARTDAASTGESTASRQPEASAATTPGWTWRVGQLRVADAVVDLRGAPEPLPLAVAAGLEKLSSEPGSRSPIELSVAAGEGGGELRLAGELAPSPLGFDGRLTVDALALAPLLARIEAPAVHWLVSGSLRADLLLRLAGDLRATGRVGLANLDLEEAATAKQFGVEWKDLELAIQRFSFRDLVAPADGPAHRSLELSLARVGLVEPRLILTRGEAGLVLPPLLPNAEPEAQAATEPAAPTVATDAGSSTVAEPTAESAPEAKPSETGEPGLPIRIRVAEARIEGGRLKLADRQVEPFYRGRIEAIALHATGARWPEKEVEVLELTAEGLRGAKLSLAGSIGPGRSKLDGELELLPLEQFNPYLTSTGYDLKSGALSLKSRIRLAPEKLKTKSRIVVAALDVGGSDGQKAFQESFGVPLDVALGLLKDLDGKITLAIPVAGKPDNMKVGIGRLVGQALRKALVGALASPLKLLGAATRDGKIADPTPAPIVFSPGEATLAPEAAERVEEIAGLLAASPGIALHLAGQTDTTDGRIVIERALLKQLEASRGVRALASLGEISTRRAVREHLARKLAGQSAKPLAAADARWLESHLAHATAPAEILESLAMARAETLRAALASDHGIAAARLVIVPVRISPPAQVPGVAIALGLPAKVEAKADAKLD